MKSYIDKWQESFNQQLPHIQIAFDALFAEGKLDDYYTLRADKEDDLLILVIAEHKNLPRQIEEALIEAFNQSKPDV